MTSSGTRKFNSQRWIARAHAKASDWENWISAEDKAHIQSVAKSVQDGFLPASAALGAVNAERIAAEAEFLATGPARTLQMIRNVGVLVPIIFTWLSFALASSAYSASVALANHLAQVNGQQNLFSDSLLQQWERGFTVSTAQLGFLPIHLTIFGWRWFTFSHFAIFDALLIIALALITYEAHAREITGLHRARAAMRGVEVRLFQIAENRLSHGPVGQTIEEKTQRSFDEIGHQLMNIQEAIRQFTTAMNDVPQITLQSVTDRLAAFETGQLNRINESYTHAAEAQRVVNEQASLFIRSNGTVLQQITQAVEKLREHWSTLGNLETEVGTSARQAAEAARDAARLAGDLPAEIRNLATAQDGVKAELDRISSRYETSIKRLEVVASHFDQTSEIQQQMKTVQSGVRDQLASLNRTGQAMTDLLRRIEALEEAVGSNVAGRNNSKPRLIDRIRRRK